MAVHVFALGKPTPFGPMPDGAALTLGPDSLTLVVSLSQPTRAEMRALRRGRLRVGLTGPTAPGSAALLVWRFEPQSPASRGLWLDSPFHIGRNGRAERYLQERAPHEHRTVFIVVQDEAARFCGGRLVTLSPQFCTVLERLVAAQASAAQGVGWDYVQSVQQVLARWSSPQDAMREATAVEVAGLSRWPGEMKIEDMPAH